MPTRREVREAGAALPLAAALVSPGPAGAAAASTERTTAFLDRAPSVGASAGPDIVSAT